MASAEDWLSPMLDAFGPREAMAWAEASGAAGVHREHGAGVSRGDEGLAAVAGMAAADRGGAAAGLAVGRLGRRGWVFDTGRARCCGPSVTVLALGGASWRRLGSDGEWAPLWRDKGVDLAPFRPANMGFRVDWTPHMAPHLGQPLKSVRLIAGDQSVPGEAVISARGIEGGGVYAVSAAVRDGAPFAIDLAPDRSVEDIAARLAATSEETHGDEASRHGAGPRSGEARAACRNSADLCPTAKTSPG
jgi:predicted flavoprotein YhiN